MKNKYWTLLLIGFILIGSFFVFQMKNKKDFDKNDIFQITSNAILYIQKGCYHCQIQEDKFGEYSELLNIVDCFENLEQCIQANITATPTWIINGEQYKRVFEVDELKELIENGNM